MAHAHPQFAAHAPAGLASPFVDGAETVRRIVAGLSAALARLAEAWGLYEVLLAQDVLDFNVDSVDVQASTEALAAAHLNVQQAEGIAAAGPDVAAAIGAELMAALPSALGEAKQQLAHFTHLHKTLAPMAEDDEARKLVARLTQKHGEALAYVETHPPRFVWGKPPRSGGQAPLEMENIEAKQSLIIMRVQLEWSLKDIADYINKNGLHPVGHTVSWNGAVARMCKTVGAEGPRSTQKAVDVERVVKFMLGHVKLCQYDGVDSVASALRRAGIPYTWSIVRMYWRAVNPLAAAARFQKTVQRVVYTVTEAMVLLHIDGCHHLDRYKIVIHGGICGGSHKVMWLHAANNNSAETVGALFMRFIKKHGVPKRVRSDHGGENLHVWGMLLLLQARGYSTQALTGRSVHNQRIERLWVDVKKVTRIVKDMLKTWEEAGELDIDDLEHRIALHHVIIPFLQDRLDDFLANWNEHRMSTMRQTPNASFAASIAARASKQQPVTVLGADEDFAELDEARRNAIAADTAAIVGGVPEALFGVESYADADARAADPPSRIVVPPATRIAWWSPECFDALALVVVPRFAAESAAERDVSAELRSAFLHAKEVVRDLRNAIANAVDDAEAE